MSVPLLSGGDTENVILTVPVALKDSGVARTEMPKPDMFTPRPRETANETRISTAPPRADGTASIVCAPAAIVLGLEVETKVALRSLVYSGTGSETSC